MQYLKQIIHWKEKIVGYMRQRIKSVIWKVNSKQKYLEEKIPKTAQNQKRIIKNEESLRNILNNMRSINILIMGIPEGEERQQGIENLCEEIMTENFPNLVKEKDTQVQEVQSPK